MAPKGSSVGGDYAGSTREKLVQAQHKVNRDQSKVNILVELKNKGLCTRDIMNFIEGQGRIRIINKEWDATTARQAMTTKIKDSKQVLTRSKSLLVITKKQCLDTLEGNRFKLRKLCKSIKQDLKKEDSTRVEKDSKKMQHLQRQLVSKKEHKNAPRHQPTRVPDRLSEYSSLPILRSAKEMPKPQALMGPFLCSPDIKLSRGEKQILSKDPKYSLMVKCNSTECTVETERMMSKHRYNENMNRKNNSEVSGTLTKHLVEDKLCEHLEANVNSKNSSDDSDLLKKTWEKELHRHIFNPFDKTLNFNKRRPTDYKLNTRVKLPKPLSEKEEFHCEMKRQQYSDTMDEFINEQEEQYSQIKSDVPINLSKRERIGLKTLRKRIADDELIVCSTDKSGRFSVMTHEQYIQAGMVHTKKDQEIDWAHVRYLKNQVNSHVSWLARILQYGKDTDQERMAANLITGQDLPDMSLLVKDHKMWSFESGAPVPTRPVVSGNCTINTHLSELLSEVIEPIALEQEGSEIQSSEEALALIDELNSKLSISQENNVLIKFRTEQSQIDGSDLDLHSTRPVCDSAELNSTNMVERGETLISVTKKLDTFSDFSSKETSEPGRVEQRDTGGEVFDEEIERVRESDVGDVSTEAEIVGEEETANTITEEDSSLIETLVQLATESDVRVQGMADSEFSYKKPGLITDYFGLYKKRGGEDKDHCNMENEDWNERLENINRREYSGTNRITLNDRLLKGKRAGDYWAGSSMGITNVGIMPTVQQLEEKLNLPPIQDLEEKPVLFGSDVVGLYPNLDNICVSKIAARTVMNTKVEFKGINFNILAVYLVLVLGTYEMGRMGLANCVPKRNNSSKSRSLTCRTNKKMNNWNFETMDFSELNKKRMVSVMVQLMVLLLTSTTCYKFGGRIFKQKNGLGIGLRASAALARLTMCFWDASWGRVQYSWGLTIRLLYRYVDDLRIMLRPIGRGWSWGSKGWEYNIDTSDDRTSEQRTIEEVGKSLNAVWKFLSFTTEGEKDFSDGFLPTLDFKTKVEGNGYIRYRFFSKPMTSNTLLLRGTALSKSCMFSSLRQDLLRRLYNTDYDEGAQVRCGIIREYIQLMINSGHVYQYIKSVVLQALTKYVYVVYRSRLEKDHRMFSPLHRPKTFNGEKRKLIKYTTQALWYSNDRPGDKFRNVWKNWIVRKGRKKAGGNSSRPGKDIKTTTVVFVPKTEEGKLMEKVQVLEDNLSVKIGWRAKVLEKPGEKLLFRFGKKFKMQGGCSRGDKCICENKGIGCTTKRIVYRATCQKCEHQGKTAGDIGTYIGESARQLGDRALEHFNKAEDFKEDSFMIKHWLQEHPLDTSMPSFKFEVLSVHKDALSRQLKEAVVIRKEGNLNSKLEFTHNELIRVQASKYSWELKDDHNRQKLEEKKYERNLDCFVTVMNDVKYRETQRLIAIDPSNAFRFKSRRKRSSEENQVGANRPKRMNARTSTPKEYREAPDTSLDSSPVGPLDHSDGYLDKSLVEQAAHGGELTMDMEGMGVDMVVIKKVEVLKITPPRPEPPAVTIARRCIAANETWGAKEDFRRRTMSLPTSTIGLEIKVSKLGKDHNMSKSLGDISDDSIYESLHEETKWKRHHSDSKSVELEDDVYYCKDDGKENKLDVVDHFNEGSDEREVEEIIKKKTKNIFFELSNKAKEWEEKNGGFTAGGMSELGNKRKIRSPETGTPSRTRARSTLSYTGSPTLRNRASTLSDVISRPKKDLKSRRRLSESLARGQKRLTSFWPRIDNKDSDKGGQN